MNKKVKHTHTRKTKKEKKNQVEKTSLDTKADKIMLDFVTIKRA